MFLDNIAGYEKEKQELKELNELLLNYDKYNNLGIQLPRGVVITGNSGVGKTIMAKSLASNQINLVELCAGDCCGDIEFIKDKIHKAFTMAISSTPSVLLLDDLDKIAATCDDYYIQENFFICKLLIKEIDSIPQNLPLLIVATCNRNYKKIMYSLLRPGRFGRIINIPNPSKSDRMKILDFYLSKINFPIDVNLDRLSELTSNLSGAALKSLVNDTAAYAISHNLKKIDTSTFNILLDNFALKGLKEDPIKDPDERYLVAVHEAGHALVALMLLPDCIESASIIPQGFSNGCVSCIIPKGHFEYLKDEEKNIAVTLAGDVADRLFIEDVNLGNKSDISRASSMIYSLMFENAAYGYCHTIYSNFNTQTLAPETIKTFNDVFNRISNLAKMTILENIELYNAIVKELTEKNRLSREELIELKNNYNKQQVA